MRRLLPLTVVSFMSFMSMAMAQNVPLTQSMINAPNGVAGLDPSGSVTAPLKGKADNATVGNVPLGNLIPLLQQQNRAGSNGLNAGTLTTPGALNITTTLSTANAQTSQQITTANNGSADSTTPNAKTAFGVSMIKNQWNATAQSSVPVGSQNGVDFLYRQGGYGPKDGNGNYTIGNNGQNVYLDTQFSGYGNNAALSGTSQYACTAANSSDPFQPQECLNNTTIPFSMSYQMGGINIFGTSPSTHTASVLSSNVTAGSWNGLVFSASSSGALNRILSYTDAGGIQQLLLDGQGNIDASHILLHSPTTGSFLTNCEELGNDTTNSGKLTLGCGASGAATSTPSVVFNGYGYSAGVTITQTTNGALQILTKSPTDSQSTVVMQCNNQGCSFPNALSTSGTVAINNGATIVNGLNVDTVTMNASVQVGSTYANLGVPSAVGTQRYCLDCTSPLKSNNYTYPGIPVLWNGHDWTDVVGNPANHP